MSDRPSPKAAYIRLPRSLGASRRLLKAVFPLVIGVACIILLNTKLEGLDFRAVADVVRTTSFPQWIAAAAATAVSFWAIGTYDVVVHRHLRTGVPDNVARVTGASSIAIAQVLGLGIVTGSLARWRMLQGAGGGMAAAITGVVSASFLGAWALVMVLLALVLPGASLPFGVTGLVLLGAVAVFALAFAAPTLRIRSLSLRLPSLRSLGSLSVLALIDIVAAAVALHVLMPAHLDIGFEVLLPIFAIALGCGLFSSTPGGAGPFELAVLTFLPQIDQAPLLGAILAWRLIYYAVPAVLAVIPLAFPYRLPAKSAPDAGFANLSHASRAECNVMRQNGGFCLSTGRDTSVVAETGQTLTLMFDPLHGTAQGVTQDLAREARNRMLIPVIYKCSGPLASAARDAGWHVARVADDAVVDLAAFNLDGSKYRQLRRKLRNVEKAGVTVAEEKVSDALLDDMARVDVAWLATHNHARGFSMGHFCPEYVAHQRIITARRDGELLGFVTFHQTSADMALDLMRHGDDLPDGVMHAMIVAGIEGAKAEGRTRLSLAALPAKCECDGKLGARLRAEITKRSGGAGLTRFKESFGVRRQPLYAAAPSRLGLAVGLADIARAVHATRG
ncbi:phosphatidylglycerol lysyltransferase domain-containing protein [Pseudooceanicola sp. MF1-13]|uniref:phosphatidylglycerol lysyltransferase domain-containing protein n=1 Tax=Pseudooceanicola sp. MF1-13 TaxID=3379095 RepID=UPI003891B461